MGRIGCPQNHYDPRLVQRLLRYACDGVVPKDGISVVERIDPNVIRSGEGFVAKGPISLVPRRPEDMPDVPPGAPVEFLCSGQKVCVLGDICVGSRLEVRSSFDQRPLATARQVSLIVPVDDLNVFAIFLPMGEEIICCKSRVVFVPFNIG